MKNQPILPELKHPFWVEEIYRGEADLGEEVLAGHRRTYNIDGQVYITEDTNPDNDEVLIATMTLDYYNQNI